MAKLATIRKPAQPVAVPTDPRAKRKPSGPPAKMATKKATKAKR